MGQRWRIFNKGNSNLPPFANRFVIYVPASNPILAKSAKCRIFQIKVFNWRKFPWSQLDWKQIVRKTPTRSKWCVLYQERWLTLAHCRIDAPRIWDAEIKVFKLLDHVATRKLLTHTHKVQMMAYIWYIMVHMSKSWAMICMKKNHSSRQQVRTKTSVTW